MAWTSKITLDVDKPDVGFALAIWNVGLADEFRYERRAKINTADKNAFVAEAKAALVAYQTKTTAEANFTSIVTLALNS